MSVWYENPGNNLSGTWKEHVVATFSGSGTNQVVNHMSEVAVGDIDGNGKVDIVTRDISHGVFIFYQNTDGSWKDRVFIRVNPREGLDLLDLDNDQDLDIIINGVWLETPNTSTARANGANYNRFSYAPAWYPANQTGSSTADYACQIAIGNFNGDNRPDIAITNSEELQNSNQNSSKPNGIRVYLAPVNPKNPNDPWIEKILETDHFSWHSIEIADFNNDGRNDLFSATSDVGKDTSPAKLLVFYGSTSGNFTKQAISLPGGLPKIYNSCVGDADGDGDVDILAPSDFDSGPINYIRNLSSGSTPVAPSAPNNLALNSPNSSTVSVSWNDTSSNETGFLLQRRNAPGGTFSNLATVSANSQSYSDTTVSAGQSYAYRIRANGSAGNSAYSEEQTISVQESGSGGGTTGPLNPPSGLSGTVLTGTSVSLIWADNSSNETGFRVQRKNVSTGTNFTTIANVPKDTTSYVDTALASGDTYKYLIRATNDDGNSTSSNVITLTPAGSSGAPDDGGGSVTLNSDNIGSTSTPGSVTTNSDGSWEIQAGGADIWGQSDQFFFLNETISGDATLTLQVDGISGSDEWSKAGVMIRETLDADSANAFAVIHRAKSPGLQYRSIAGAETSKIISGSPVLPTLIRLNRSGNVFTASTSINGGSTWQIRGTQTISMNSTVYAGIAVCAHGSGTVTASLDKYEVTTSTQPSASQGFEAGITTASADGEWRTVNFNTVFPSVPIVVVGPVSQLGNEPVTARVRNITESGFEVRVQEWDYLDGIHPPEWLSYLAAVEDLQSIGGLDCKVGKTTASSISDRVNFDGSFAEAPVVLSQLISENNTYPGGTRSLVTRNESVSSTGFSVRIQSHEGFNDALSNETVGFIAIAQGTGTIGQSPVASSTENSTPKWRDLDGDGKTDPFTLAHGVAGSNPVFLAAMQTSNGNDPCSLRYGNIISGSLDFTLEEDTFYPETDHAPEKIGYFIIGE